MLCHKVLNNKIPHKPEPEIKLDLLRDADDTAIGWCLNAGKQMEEMQMRVLHTISEVTFPAPEHLAGKSRLAVAWRLLRPLLISKLSEKLRLKASWELLARIHGYERDIVVQIDRLERHESIREKRQRRRARLENEQARQDVAIADAAKPDGRVFEDKGGLGSVRKLTRHRQEAESRIEKMG